MAKPIKTKVVATVGPASMETPVLIRLIRAGVDMFRINFSHGSDEQHQTMLDNIRKAQAEVGLPLAVMADLCGPKIRVGQIEGGGVLLAEGADIVIQRKPVVGTAERISTTLGELVDDVRKGQRILLDDGKIELRVVESRAPKEVVCKVVTGGILASSKGINLPQTSLKLSALTEKDRKDAAWIAKRDFDYVALSFVQRKADVQALRRILKVGKSEARVVSKIEKPKALANINAIIKASDALLVARGDLGVEMPIQDVPLMQKQLVKLCERAGRTCIVATQMLETMTQSPTPTRAEVSDVANAVLDGADAVMLSGETAVGKYPVQAVTMMNQIACRVENHFSRTDDGSDVHHAGPTDLWQVAEDVNDVTAAIARAMHVVTHCEKVQAVVAYTMTGRTAEVLAKMRLDVPILALTPSHRVMQQACLFYGVEAAEAEVVEHTTDVLALAVKHVRRLRWARKGQRIVVVSGRPLGKPGMTSNLAICEV